MALSPHEERVFADLEAALRADDPVLAALLGLPAAPPPAPPAPTAPPDPTAPPARRLPARHLVHLVVALLALIVVAALWRDTLGTAGMVAATAVLVLPWLILTAHAVVNRSATRGSGPFAQPPGPVESALVLGCVVTLATMLTPPRWAPVVGIMSTVALVPWFVMHAMAWIDRTTPRRPATD